MIWRATADLQLGLCLLSETLTMEAPDFAAAVTRAQSAFSSDAMRITGVALATCGTTADEATCGLPATRTDGLCDDCREWAVDRYIAGEERP
jgi:hypothetical protein